MLSRSSVPSARESLGRGRVLCLDLETTGRYVSQGDQIVSVGVAEMVDGRLTGRTFYREVNPTRCKVMPEESLAIHGLTIEYLRGKPS